MLVSIDQQIINSSIDATPAFHLSKPIGVLNAKNEFVTIIPENTPLPVRRVYTFSNVLENQKEIYVSIWEGEYKKVSQQPTLETDNIVNNNDGDGSDIRELPEQSISIIKPEKLIAELVIDDLPSKKEGQLKVEFTIEIDENNKCTIIAKESSVKKLELVISA